MTLEPASAAAGEPPPSHQALIALARQLPVTADGGDLAELSERASSLLQGFVRRVEAERPVVLRLPPLTARLIERGQRRIVDQLVSLVLEADLGEDTGRCRSHAREVSSLLELEIVSEEWDRTLDL